MTEPRGIRNNNPGNIDTNPTFTWRGQIEGSDPRFCTFENMAFGVRALALLLMTYTQRDQCRTVRQVINRWAPAVENNTQAYVDDVAIACGISPDATITPLQQSLLTAMVKAITVHENGPGNWLAPSALSLGIGNAFGTVPLADLEGYHDSPDAS